MNAKEQLAAVNFDLQPDLFRRFTLEGEGLVGRHHCWQEVVAFNFLCVVFESFQLFVF